MEAHDEGADLDVVRRAIDAWNADDWEALEALNDPEITIRAPDGWPESGEFAGWQAVRRQFERLKESWSEEHIEAIELRDLGAGRVLLRAHWRGHGEASGLELDLAVDVTYTVSEGRITRTEFSLPGEPAG